MDAAWTVAAVLLPLSLGLGVRLQGERARRKQQGLFSKWPVQSIDLDALDPVFATGPFGPSLDTEVQFVGRGPLGVPGGTTDAEAWILAVLAKRAHQLFEFGTCTGKTAYLWSRNASSNARIATLTLAPGQQGTYRAVQGDATVDHRFALEESAFDSFLYTGTPAADRIDQLYGDSKAFDDTPWHDWADLVFVDGSHARSYVESDSQKAMRIVKPGGLVLWHDYAGPKHAAGVYGALNAMVSTVALRHVRGTTFVAWRRPLGDRSAGPTAPREDVRLMTDA